MYLKIASFALDVLFLGTSLELVGSSTLSAFLPNKQTNKKKKTTVNIYAYTRKREVQSEKKKKWKKKEDENRSLPKPRIGATKSM